MNTLDLNIIIKELKILSLPSRKMILCAPLNQLTGKTPQVLYNFMRSDNDPKNDILSNTYLEINTEREKLINEVNGFFNAPLNKDEVSVFEGKSIKEIYELILGYSVRLRRLMMVYSPHFNHSESKGVPKGKKYDMVKINWVDDDGQIIRKVTRTYGQAGELGLSTAIPKVLENYLEDITGYTLLEQPINGIRFDLLVNTSDNKTWAIEFKLSKKDDFIQTAVRLEIWEAYKKLYLN